MAGKPYPPVSFYFQVRFEGLSQNEVDIRFQSVSGLDIQQETETYKEGGENRFEHVLPVRTKYPDLVLKRGVVRPTESAVTDWCLQAFQDQKYQPIDLQVSLLNEKGQPLVYWKVIHAWPKNWKFSELNAEKGEVFIETLELNYNRHEYKKGN